jgi:hypothetical protein
MSRINVARFSVQIESLCNNLDGFDTYYSDLIDARNDMYCDIGYEEYGYQEY